MISFRNMPDCGENRCLFYCIGAVVGVIAFILVIVLPMSFVTLEYNEVRTGHEVNTVVNWFPVSGDHAS